MKNKTVDVAVIGGGPSGMAAALSAAEQGAEVLLIETDPMLGGILNQCIHNGFGLHVFGEELTGPEYADRFRKKVEAAGIEIMLGTLVLEITKGLQIRAVNSDGGIINISAGAVVVSTGCRERPRGAIGISGTRPAGIFSAGTAQRFVNIEGYMPGKRCVILGSGDIGLIMARRMTFEGAEVCAVVELMPFSSGLARNIKQCLDDFGVPLLLSHTITQIHGSERITGVTVAAVDENKNPVPDSEQFIACDCLLLSVGLIPQIELATDAGAEPSPKSRSVRVDDRFETSVPGLFACGNTLHVHDLVDYVTQESAIAGKFAALHALKRLSRRKNEIELRVGSGIAYTVPHHIGVPAESDVTVRFRPTGVFKDAVLSAQSGEETLLSKKVRVMAPGEMESLTLTPEIINKARGEIVIKVVE